MEELEWRVASGLCVLGQGNISGGLLNIHYKEQHQKRLFGLAIVRLRKNTDILLRLHLCACATTAKPPRGIGLKGCWARGVLPMGRSRVIPEMLTPGKRCPNDVLIENHITSPCIKHDVFIPVLKGLFDIPLIPGPTNLTLCLSIIIRALQLDPVFCPISHTSPFVVISGL